MKIYRASKMAAKQLSGLVAHVQTTVKKKRIKPTPRQHFSAFGADYDKVFQKQRMAQRLTHTLHDNKKSGCNHFDYNRFIGGPTRA
jgi:hypothetical protein